MRPPPQSTGAFLRLASPPSTDQETGHRGAKQLAPGHTARGGVGAAPPPPLLAWQGPAEDGAVGQPGPVPGVLVSHPETPVLGSGPGPSKGERMTA